jgi:DNA topoisomerase-1
MTSEFLLSNFDKMMDYGFTAAIEKELDDIANGTLNWVNVVRGVFNYMNPIIEKIGLVLSHGGSSNRIELGINPETDLPISLILTQYGWSICEENPDKKQSRWASIGDTNPKSITLEDSIKYLVYPKNLDDYNGEKLQLLKAKTVYIKLGKTNYNIEQYKQLVDSEGDLDVNTLNRDKVIEIIKYLDNANAEMKKKQSEEIIIKGLSDCIIKNGPYGYYIKYKNKHNIPLPKKIKEDITSLTLDMGLKIVAKFKQKAPALKK